MSSGSRVRPGDFEDDPDSFKGRTITINAQFGMRHSFRGIQRVHKEDGDSSFDVMVFTISPHCEFVLTVPTNLSVPALEEGESAYYTFRCTKGLTDEGNLVTHIRRPDKYGE